MQTFSLSSVNCGLKISDRYNFIVSYLSFIIQKCLEISAYNLHNIIFGKGVSVSFKLSPVFTSADSQQPSSRVNPPGML